MPRPIGLVSKKAVSLHTRITSRVSPPRSHSRASQSHRTSHRRTSSGPVRLRAVPASRLREAPPRAPTPPVKSCRFGCAVFQKTKKAARDGGVFESAHHGQGELGRGGWTVQVRHYGDAGVAHEYGGTRARRYRSPAVSIASRVAPPPARRERRNFGNFPRRHPSGAGKVSRGRRKISRPLPLSPALTEPIPGLRPQDAHATVLGLDEDTAFFGVYDGHGGKEVRANPAPVAPKAESNLTTFRVFDNRLVTPSDLPPKTRSRWPCTYPGIFTRCSRSASRTSAATSPKV